MALVSLLSNPRSSGNQSMLPRVRSFCARHDDIFHYEVEHVDQIGAALRSIARVKPKVLVVNGGDGTVQAALTEIHNGAHFGDQPPPMAVLASGKTNLIALDLGAQGHPIEALERLVQMAQGDLSPHIVPRELIALRHGEDGEERPVIGMFLGGAGLADTMLYCRQKIYPLGLPNGMAHVLTAMALLTKLFLRLKASFLPPDPRPLNVSMRKEGSMLSGRFSVLAVTTLDKLLLSQDVGGSRRGALKLIAIEDGPIAAIRALFASAMGRIGRQSVRGLHYEEASEISIEGEDSHLILDGEMFRTQVGRPIVLSAGQPLSFVRLAA